MKHVHRHTPRHRILDETDPEVAAEYAELFKTTPERWELHYSDGSMVAGSTQEEWDAAPDTDVQFLLWKEFNGTLHVIYGPETYALGGKVKYGKWMNDPEFFTMREALRDTSPLCRGE